jgi:hypothetical protein
MSKVLELVLAGTTAQFDADASLATCEFVQRASGNSRGYVGFTTNQNLTAAHCGKDIYASTSSGAITLTLPAASLLPAGSKFRIMNTGVDDVVIARAGADTIVISTTYNTVTSITLKAGDWVELVSLGSGTLWYHGGGTAQMGKSGAFASTQGASWSQTLPSGLILKGGTGSITTNTTILFPVAFPNNCYTVSLTNGPNPTSGNYTFEMEGISVAGFIASAFVATSGAAATRTLTYLAVGN